MDFRIFAVVTLIGILGFLVCRRLAFRADAKDEERPLLVVWVWAISLLIMGIGLLGLISTRPETVMVAPSIDSRLVSDLVLLSIIGVCLVYIIQKGVNWLVRVLSMVLKERK